MFQPHTLANLTRATLEPLVTVEDPAAALLPLPLRSAGKEDLRIGDDFVEVLRGARAALLRTRVGRAILCSSRPCRATQKSPRRDNILKEASSLSTGTESPAAIVSPMSLSILLRSARPLLDRSWDGFPLSLGVAAYAVVPVKDSYRFTIEREVADARIAWDKIVVNRFTDYLNKYKAVAKKATRNFDDLLMWKGHGPPSIKRDY
ncbi:hypothetical protein Taro_035447 [Colocasia esculenta]|uniref:Uncharacterized protein n=1 Tax=Colocasia esculenta TaxID=4460 RepID=A0A843W6P9_COLES|nr:hypothetical protein [Colocasia esculenta]